MKNQSYDLNGDIHGQHDKLMSILQGLGYMPRDEAPQGQFAGWSHPEGRKIVFLGDFIDRGPRVREVLPEVRGMFEVGDALAIMGNHEFSAILHEAAGEAPTKASADLRTTLDQFTGAEIEWVDAVAWMRGLPLFLDLNGLLAIHACWDERAIAELSERSLADKSFLLSCLDQSPQERKAVERLIVGLTLSVPDDALVFNSKGMPLPNVRVRWWNLPVSRYPIGDLVFPEVLAGRGTIDPDTLIGMPNYSADSPPAFFGHYWLPPDNRKHPLLPNLACLGCLDYSGGRGEAPLVAYRWDGEQILSEAKFFGPNPS